MAKNFKNAGSTKKIKEIAKVSAEKAQVIVVKMINNDNLHDYPNNREDITDTIDLENSIKELGFVDPIEITSFGQNEGEYMIVSGHRRRSAGVKCGVEVFPCIIKSFNSESEIENYVLLANSQRDSAKDPLLFCKRYKMHEEYLKKEKFKGKMRDEIAKRLGISISQADRYNMMNKVILPVWDMVRDEIVGMSSVLPMASHSEDEQWEIYTIMQESLKKNVSLTRETVKLIVDKYREGKIVDLSRDSRDSGLSLDAAAFENKKKELGEPISITENDKINKEREYLGDSGLSLDAVAFENKKKELGEPISITENDKTNKEREYLGDSGLSLDAAAFENNFENNLKKMLLDLNLVEFENQDEVLETLKKIRDLFILMIDEMYNISIEYNLEDNFKRLLQEFVNRKD